MKSFAALLLACTSACASTTRADLPKPSLVGIYCLNGSQAAMQLELKADGTYQAYVDAGLRMVAVATGTWTYEDGELLVSQSDQTRGWHHYMAPISVLQKDNTVVLTGDFYGSLSKRASGGCEL